jgi:hypothetical protein
MKAGIKKTLATLAVAASLVGGGALVAPVRAEAATVRTMSINAIDVCRSQGHFGASYVWYWNPNSWYCYDPSFPWGFSVSGPPQFGAYCRARGYLAAEAWPNNVWGWRCFKYV